MRLDYIILIAQQFMKKVRLLLTRKQADFLSWLVGLAKHSVDHDSEKTYKEIDHLLDKISKALD